MHGTLLQRGLLKWAGVDWTDLAQNRDLWRAVVNMKRTTGFCTMQGNSCLAEVQFVFQCFCAKHLVTLLRFGSRYGNRERIVPSAGPN